eukprot:6492168-Amphidinium_carterae.9
MEGHLGRHALNSFPHFKKGEHEQLLQCVTRHATYPQLDVPEHEVGADGAFRLENGAYRSGMHGLTLQGCEVKTDADIHECSPARATFCCHDADRLRCDDLAARGPRGVGAIYILTCNTPTPGFGAPE